MDFLDEGCSLSFVNQPIICVTMRFLVLADLSFLAFSDLDVKGFFVRSSTGGGIVSRGEGEQKRGKGEIRFFSRLYLGYKYERRRTSISMT